MPRRTKTDPNTQRDALILEIAQRQFRLETLETRNWDRLDFHDVAVWAIRAALGRPSRPDAAQVPLTPNPERTSS